jgi:hypothetical protein
VVCLKCDREASKNKAAVELLKKKISCIFYNTVSISHGISVEFPIGVSNICILSNTMCRVSKSHNLQ